MLQVAYSIRFLYNLWYTKFVNTDIQYILFEEDKDEPFKN